MVRAIVITLMVGVAVPVAAQTGVEVARTYLEAHEVQIVRNYAEFLTYPNRARDVEDVTRAASYIRDRMIDAGVEARLLTIDGAPPLVYGEWIVPGATRTLGI